MAVKDAVEDFSDEETLGYGIDGCSAPNFIMSLTGLAKSMAKIATASDAKSGAMNDAALRVRRSMYAHPHLVVGNGRACTKLMGLLPDETIVKTGAEAVFVAAIPSLKLGVALKVLDGNSRGSEVAITQILVELGLLDPVSPEVQALLNPDITNWHGIITGTVGPAQDRLLA